MLRRPEGLEGGKGRGGDETRRDEEAVAVH